MLCKLPIVLICCFIISNSLCLPAAIDRILRFRNQRQENGYQFEYITSDGQRREETGIFEYQPNKEEPVLHVRGSYSYVDSFGRQFTVYYEAGDKGSKTEGDIIPPFTYQEIPPIPPPQTDEKEGNIIPPLPPLLPSFNYNHTESGSNAGQIVSYS